MGRSWREHLDTLSDEEYKRQYGTDDDAEYQAYCEQDTSNDCWRDCRAAVQRERGISGDVGW